MAQFYPNFVEDEAEIIEEIPMNESILAETETSHLWWAVSTKESWMVIIRDIPDEQIYDLAITKTGIKFAWKSDFPNLFEVIKDYPKLEDKDLVKHLG